MSTDFQLGLRYRQLLLLAVVIVSVVFLHDAMWRRAIEPTTTDPTPTGAVNSVPAAAPQVPSGVIARDLIYRGVVDSMDGIGYAFKDLKEPPQLDPRFEQLDALPECELGKDKTVVDTDVPLMMEKFLRCIDPIIRDFKNSTDLVLNFVEKTMICDQDSLIDSLNIQEFNNLHETKWTILPKCKDQNTMVTLGIGHDTKAEEHLNRTLPHTKFYGADPIIEPNIQLYSAFGGKFFPFAVGKKSGTSVFKVLPNQNQKTRKYVHQDVTTIEVNYFLKNVLNLRRIDIMWIDIEGGEFEFLDYLHRGGIFDDNGISICQFNIEVHPDYWENGFAKFDAWIKKVVEQKRWMFIRPRATGPGVFRMFFVNVEDQKCVRKFLQ